MSLSVPQKMSDLLQNGSSRYEEEFVEITSLGEGGFGKVFKVKNILDGQEYAVKQISLKATKSDLCGKVLREVEVLAPLNHINVVRYHAAWLEYVTTDNVNSALPRVATPPTRLKEPRGMSSPKIIEESTDRQIVFEGSSQDSSDSGIVSSEVESRVRSPRSISSSSRSSRTPYPGSHVEEEHSDHVDEEHSEQSENTLSGNKCLVLFIQMQLCTTALKDWLVKRNKEISLNGAEVDRAAVMVIFRQLVKGVEYIHSQKLLHRDLKPGNIFLQEHRHETGGKPTIFQVKIGDFGLARKEVVVSPGNSPLSELGGKDAMTVGVGTATYASPEQRNSTKYDNKADIFSLGIILFELLCAFGTEMELVTNIEDLNKGKLPQEFREKWPKESELILEMTAENPSDRPTAESLLALSLFEEKHAQMGHHLHEKVKEQTSEIMELKTKLLEKEEELHSKTAEIMELRRQLDERDEYIKHIFDKMCTECGQKLAS